MTPHRNIVEPTPEGGSMVNDTIDLPDWARRIRDERNARDMSHRQFVTALRAHSERELPGDESMLRRVKAWQAGESHPDDFYRPLIARTFGMPTAATFGMQGGRRNADDALISGTGLHTMAILP